MSRHENSLDPREGSGLKMKNQESPQYSRGRVCFLGERVKLVEMCGCFRGCRVESGLARWRY